MNFMKRICILGNVRIRARWIGPYALRGVSQSISWVLAALLADRQQL